MALFSEPQEPAIELKTLDLDGRLVYVFENKREAEALTRLARNYLFMQESKRRWRKRFWLVSTFIGFLISIAVAWPHFSDFLAHVVGFFS